MQKKKRKASGELVDHRTRNREQAPGLIPVPIWTAEL